MTLCSNRPDGGFGPYYRLPDNTLGPGPGATATGQGGGGSVLSTCFDDVIIIPLGSWLFLLFTALLVSYYTIHRKQSSKREKDIELSPPVNAIITGSNDHPQPPRSATVCAHKDIPQQCSRPQWRKSRITLLVLCTFLLVAQLAMQVLEFARLAANSQGVGLLPFTLVPLLIVLLSLYLPGPWSHTLPPGNSEVSTHPAGMIKRPEGRGLRNRKQSARPHTMPWLAIVTIWCLWMSIAYGIKIWSLSRLYRMIGTEAYDGVDSKYPYSDKIIDTVVILIVYYAFLLLYVHLVYLDYRPFSLTRWPSRRGRRTA